ncbi:MAG TPA: hypothetical protein VND95_04920 [Stellaceae bacterium]|nr:hypothetical protein [Stellaceae bacterium]
MAAAGAVFLVLGWQEAAAAAGCDEYDPAGPARSAQVTLTSGDAADESRDELRSFILTGSLGRVTVAVVSSNPGNIVRGVSATPEISRFSPRYGEQLKGVAVTVRLKGSPSRAIVVLKLRQVCARYFRNTFLYY